MTTGNSKEHYPPLLQKAIITAAIVASIGGCNQPKNVVTEPAATTTSPTGFEFTERIQGPLRPPTALQESNAQAMYHHLQQLVDQTLAQAKKTGKTPCFLIGEAHHQNGGLLAELMLQKIYHARGITSFLEAPTNMMATDSVYDIINSHKVLDPYPHNQILLLYAKALKDTLHGLVGMNGKEPASANTVSADDMFNITESEINEMIRHTEESPKKPMAMLVGADHIWQIQETLANIEKSNNPESAPLKQFIQAIHIQPVMVTDTSDSLLQHSIIPQAKDYTHLNQRPSSKDEGLEIGLKAGAADAVCA